MPRLLLAIIAAGCALAQAATTTTSAPGATWTITVGKGGNVFEVRSQALDGLELTSRSRRSCQRTLVISSSSSSFRRTTRSRAPSTSIRAFRMSLLLTIRDFSLDSSRSIRF
jgi:hypothetical protein